MTTTDTDRDEAFKKEAVSRGWNLHNIELALGNSGTAPAACKLTYQYWCAAWEAASHHPAPVEPGEYEKVAHALEYRFWGEGEKTVADAVDLLRAIPVEPGEWSKAARYELALRSCRMLATRHKGEPDWDHVTRFCAEAGIKSSLLRSLSPAEQSECGKCADLLEDESYGKLHVMGMWSARQEAIRLLRAAQAHSNSVVAEVVKLLGRSTDNECTSVPFWGICEGPAGSPKLISHGIWFDRAEAEKHLSDHAYRFPKKAFVYCFSGHESSDLKGLYALLSKVSTETGEGNKL